MWQGTKVSSGFDSLSCKNTFLNFNNLLRPPPTPSPCHTHRTVQLDEVMGYIAGQDNCCVFVECSAKQNFRIDDLFYALFTASNLPLEMAPNHHRRVVTVFGAPSPLPPHSSAGGTKKNALSIKRRFSDACGVVTPNARRPSIRTDLNLMRSKTMAMNEGESSVARKKCVIM